VLITVVGIVGIMMVKVEHVEQIPDGRHVPRNVLIVVIKAGIGRLSRLRPLSVIGAIGLYGSDDLRESRSIFSLVFPLVIPENGRCSSTPHAGSEGSRQW